jgi:uroporphyrinogen-III synthase
MAHAIEAGRVSHWAVYERVDLRPHNRVLPQLAAVTLASPSAARSWASLGVQLDVPVAVIGPTTEEAARLAGLRVAAVAACPTMADLALAAVGFS